MTDFIEQLPRSRKDIPDVASLGREYSTRRFKVQVWILAI